MANHPNRNGPYELTFWGGSVGVKYRRYHKTIDAAKVEAFRVYDEMDHPRAHQAIVYDVRTDEQVAVFN